MTGSVLTIGEPAARLAVPVRPLWPGWTWCARCASRAYELPADLCDVAVPVPERWPDDDVRYVHLPSAYAAEVVAARARGWTVVGDGTGAHLDVADDPGRVAELLG